MMIITLAMFIAGLLNIMVEITFLIVVLALIAVYSIYNNNRKFKNVFSAGMLFFIVGSVFFAVLLNQHRLFAYDDFSHWALVVKQMLQNNRLPNSSDYMIGFQSYPTGEAGFIYFIAKILGETEGIMLVGKSIFSVACITPLFSLVKNKSKSSYFMLCFFAVLVLFSNNGTNTLYVDSLLTTITLGMTAIIFDSYFEKNINRAIFPLFLSTAVLVIMKNSGLLFAFILIVMFILAKLKRKDYNYPLYSLIAVASPFIFRKLWDSHTKFTFISSEETKHSLSLKNYQNTIADKTPEQIKAIVNQMVERNIKIDHFDIQIVLFIFIFLIVLIIVKKHILKNKEIKIELALFISLLLLYVLYQFGLLFTYLYSMPTGEAMALASYYRYNITMSLYILGVFTMYLLMMNNQSRNHHTIASTMMIGFLIVSIVSENEHIINGFTNKEYEESVRAILVEKKEKISHQAENHYIFYISDKERIINNGYLRYLIRYDFDTTNFNVVLQKDIDVLAEYLGKENCTLIVLYEDSNINNYLAKYNLQNVSNIVDLSKEKHSE